MRLDTRLAVALSEFTSDKYDVKDYLRGIYLIPHPSGTGTLAMASDGCIAAVAYDNASEADMTAIRSVPPRVLSEARKFAMRSERHGPSYVQWSDTHASIGAVSEVSAPISARYPDLLECLKREISALRTDTERAAGTASVNPKYMATVAKVAKPLGAGHLTLAATGDDGDAIIVRYYREDGEPMPFLAFIMPRRAPSPAPIPWIS